MACPFLLNGSQVRVLPRELRRSPCPNEFQSGLRSRTGLRYGLGTVRMLPVHHRRGLLEVVGAYLEILPGPPDVGIADVFHRELKVARRSRDVAGHRAPEAVHGPVGTMRTPARVSARQSARKSAVGW